MAKAPDAFRTISEVADWLETPAHVLRFWESKFSQVKPVKRAGGRRYYRREDMALLGGIKKLLHEDGLTIKAAQQLLRQEGVKHVSSLCELPLDGEEGEDETESNVVSIAPTAATETAEVEEVGASVETTDEPVDPDTDVDELVAEAAAEMVASDPASQDATEASVSDEPEFPFDPPMEDAGTDEAVAEANVDEPEPAPIAATESVIATDEPPAAVDEPVFDAPLAPEEVPADEPAVIAADETVVDEDVEHVAENEAPMEGMTEEEPLEEPSAELEAVEADADPQEVEAASEDDEAAPVDDPEPTAQDAFEGAPLPSFLQPAQEEEAEPEPAPEPMEPAPELPSFLTKETPVREPLGLNVPADPVDDATPARPGAISEVAAADRNAIFDNASEIASLMNQLAAVRSRRPNL